MATSTERVKRLRAREAAAHPDRVRRDYSATPEEHDKLRACLKRIRARSKK